MHCSPRARAFAILLTFAGIASASAATPPGTAPAPDAGTIRIMKAWARPTPPGLTVAAAYFEVRNTGKAADRLVEVACAGASRAEIHETRVSADGVARMRRVPAIEVPPGGAVKLEPGGAHVMLFGVKAPFVETQRVPLRVRFEKAGWIDVDVVVGPVDPGADHSMHRHH